jgi:hypothetical protein
LKYAKKWTYHSKRPRLGKLNGSMKVWCPVGLFKQEFQPINFNYTFPCLYSKGGPEFGKGYNELT